MSSITKMVIYAALAEDEALVRLNAWCAEHDEEREQQFKPLDLDAAGGMKWFVANVWAMAGNYFPYENLAEAFPTFGWRCPEDAVLLIRDEHADGTQVVTARGAVRR